MERSLEGMGRKVNCWYVGVFVACLPPSTAAASQDQLSGWVLFVAYLPFILICFQLLWIIDGNYGGIVNEERKKSERTKLDECGGRERTVWNVLSCMGRAVVYSIDLWPIHFFISNLVLFLLFMYFLAEIY